MLRPYQQKAKGDIYTSWQSTKHVVAVLPTGAGKTVLLSHIVNEFNAPTCVIAHRQELVSQISLSLATQGVRHKLIAPKNVIRNIINLHLFVLGRDLYDPNSKVATAGVDTLIKRVDQLKNWAFTVRLWVIDEAHHLLVENKWGKAVEMFPNAKGLGVTATPLRADGKGLGVDTDGVFEDMVIGPNMRELIDQGFLTDYRIFAPPSDMDLSEVNISKITGDYNKNKMVAAAKQSHIMGDVVDHYLKLARGKLGITFAPDVAMATEIAERFNAAGVPAEVVSAKTPDTERAKILKRFKNRELLQLVNVDLFGEGFDLPAIEVVSMARPTASYGLYVQIFGRGLRPMFLDGAPLGTEAERLYAIAASIKPNAIIIDHVGNVVRHGLPDANREWSLDRREKKSRGTPDDVIPVKACPECTMVYERVYTECPYCGFKPIPQERSSPEQVDGDLMELSPEVLAQMRGAVAEVDMEPEEYRLHLIKKRVPEVGQLAGMKRHRLRKEAQHELRDTMKLWGGHAEAEGRSTREAQKLFFFRFGVDIMSAQALSDKDAKVLLEKIEKDMKCLR